MKFYIYYQLYNIIHSYSVYYSMRFNDLCPASQHIYQDSYSSKLKDPLEFWFKKNMELLLRCTFYSKWASTSGGLRTFGNQSVDSTNHMSRISKGGSNYTITTSLGAEYRNCDMLGSMWAIRHKRTFPNPIKTFLCNSIIICPFSAWADR